MDGHPHHVRNHGRREEKHRSMKGRARSNSAEEEWIAETAAKAQAFVAQWAACKVAKGAVFSKHGGFAAASFAISIASCPQPLSREDYERICAAYAESTASFLLKASVVGAVVLSTVFQYASGELVEAADGVPQTVVYVHFALTQTVTASSMIVVFVSLRMYIHLTSWMPTLQDKMWYLSLQRKSVSILSFADVAILVLMTAMLLAHAIAVNGITGLMALPSLVFVLPIWLCWDNRYSRRALADRLHQRAIKLSKLLPQPAQDAHDPDESSTAAHLPGVRLVSKSNI